MRYSGITRTITGIVLSVVLLAISVIPTFAEDNSVYNKMTYGLIEKTGSVSGDKLLRIAVLFVEPPAYKQDVDKEILKQYRVRPLYEIVGEKVAEWASEPRLIGESGYSEVGAVVGATYPEMGRKLRKIMPKSFILVPGYGAQGGKGDDLVPFFNKDGLGAVVNSSRGIIAAYTKGADWVDELRSVLADNKQYVRERLKTELPKVKVIYSHGTYLMWLDCSAITNDADSLIKLIRERSGLVLTSGTEFRGHGNCFLRMNAATQRERLSDGVDRLVKALKDL